MCVCYDRSRLCDSCVLSEQLNIDLVLGVLEGKWHAITYAADITQHRVAVSGYI